MRQAQFLGDSSNFLDSPRFMTPEIRHILVGKSGRIWDRRLPLGERSSGAT